MIAVHSLKLSVLYSKKNDLPPSFLTGLKTILKGGEKEISRRPTWYSGTACRSQCGAAFGKNYIFCNTCFFSQFSAKNVLLVCRKFPTYISDELYFRLSKNTRAK